MALDNDSDGSRSEQQPFLSQLFSIVVIQILVRCLEACFVSQDCLTKCCVEGVDYLSCSEPWDFFRLTLKCIPSMGNTAVSS